MPFVSIDHPALTPRFFSLPEIDCAKNESSNIAVTDQISVVPSSSSFDDFILQGMQKKKLEVASDLPT